MTCASNGQWGSCLNQGFAPPAPRRVKPATALERRSKRAVEAARGAVGERAPRSARPARHNNNPATEEMERKAEPVTEAVNGAAGDHASPTVSAQAAPAVTAATTNPPLLPAISGTNTSVRVPVPVRTWKGGR